MSDIIAQLQVLSHESGCLLDLTAILDVAICPKVDIKTHPHHHVKDEGDTICVTPSEEGVTPRAAACDDCFTPSPQVCDKNTVALDLELLIILGLITEHDLELYLKAIGALGENDHMHNGHGGNHGGNGGNGGDNGDDGGDNGNGGDDNNDGGDNGNGNGGKGKGGKGKTVKMDPLLSLDVGGKNGLANLNVGGKDKDGLLNLDVGKDGHLLDLDLGGDDVLTLRRRKDRKLLDLQVGGTDNGQDADIDIDVLTHKPHHGHHKREAACDSCDGGNEHYLTHYQPICKKGFKQEHRDNAHHCHATDVNHCLAVCNAQSALLSIEVGSAVQVCVGIEFDSSTGDDNCRYLVGPEDEPCGDDHLEDNDNCYAFIRN